MRTHLYGQKINATYEPEMANLTKLKVATRTELETTAAITGSYMEGVIDQITESLVIEIQ